MHALPCAAESPVYGVLIVGSCQSTLPELGELFANECGMPAEMVQDLFQELVDKGAASIDACGRVYCRRMVREEASREQKRRAGREGGKKSGERRAKQTPKQTPKQTASGGVSRDHSEPSSEEVSKSEAPTVYPSHGNQTINGGSVEAEREQPASGAPSNTPSKSEHSSFFSSSSVPKGTGGHRPPDLATVIWEEGTKWLQEKTGNPEKRCRSLLGKWRKALGDEGLVELLGRAQREGIIGPIEWIEGAIRHRQTKRGELELITHGGLSGPEPTGSIFDR